MATAASSSNALKRFLVSIMKISLVPLIRPAANSPLSRLKRMTPGVSNAHLPLSSKPFFERDIFNRFPRTKRFSELVQRWTDSKEHLEGVDTVDTPECLIVYRNLSGTKPETVNVSFRHSDDLPGEWTCNFYISGEADLRFGYVPRHPERDDIIIIGSLPEKIGNYKISDIKVEIGRNSGELKVTLPKQLNGYVKPTVIDEDGFCFDANATVIDDH